MENTISLNAHSYKLIKQREQGQTRSAVVSGVTYLMDTSYLETKEATNKVVRTQRKITVMVPVTIAGTVVLRPVSVQFILSRPVDVLTTEPNINSAVAELLTWIDGDTFTSEVLNNEI